MLFSYELVFPWGKTYHSMHSNHFRNWVFLLKCNIIMDRWARAQNPLPQPYTHARPLKCAFSHTLTHAGKRVLCKRLKGQSFCFFSRSVCVCPWVCPSFPPPLRPQINLLKVQISPLKPYISFLMHQISLLSPQNSPFKHQESGPCILQNLSLWALPKVKFACPRLKRD